MGSQDVPIAVVTGASGYIGTELTKQLLDQGYTVRATSRDPSKNKFLEELGQALAGKLEPWAVDMTDDAAFDKVVQGATYVFHVASPVEFGSPDEVEADKEQIVNPAVDGVRNILKAVFKAKTVKRVVQTSSVAAIIDPAFYKPGKVYSDKDWSDGVSIKSDAYYVSKNQAERTAWQLAKEYTIDLVTICPSMVIGPVNSSKGGFSVYSVQGLLEGKPFQEQIMPLGQIDVRDVAKAHILAAEIPEANGRYILSHDHVSNRRDLSRALKECFPSYQVQDCEDDEQVAIYDTSKLQELGMGESSLVTIKKSFCDHARSLVALGLVANP